MAPRNPSSSSETPKAIKRAVCRPNFKPLPLFISSPVSKSSGSNKNVVKMVKSGAKQFDGRPVLKVVQLEVVYQEPSSLEPFEQLEPRPSNPCLRVIKNGKETQSFDIIVDDNDRSPRPTLGEMNLNNIQRINIKNNAPLKSILKKKAKAIVPKKSVRFGTDVKEEKSNDDIQVEPTEEVENVTNHIVRFGF